MRRITLLVLLFTICLIPAAFSQSAMGNWSNTGPIAFPINVSGQVDGIGRVSQIKFHPSNPAKIYAVSASGGLYISTDTGHNWAPTAGTEVLPATSLSSMCVDYTNDQILYICLGDANYYNNDYGIYKSTNGGTTWTAANASIGTRMAVEILMDPTDHLKLVAATNNGIWKTTDGGVTWTQKQAGVFRDMKRKPVLNSATLYAVTSTAAYYSTNFGDTWTAATGFTAPTGNDGTRIAVSSNDTSRVYLGTTKGNGVIFKSVNNGVGYTQIYSSTTQCLTCYDASVTSGSQGDYDFDMTANPTDANELLLVAHCVWRSTNGGTTWSKRTDWWDQMHTDMHHIEWNPYNNNQRWSANDGGVWMTTDPLATTWTTRSDGIAATEIYHAAQSPVIRDLVSIGTQDNGELYYYNGIWRCDRGGDWGSRCAFDYSTTGTVFYQQNGNKRNLAPLAGEISYNNPFNVTNNARMQFVQSMPGVAFTGKDSIYRSTNTNTGSASWTLIKASTEAIRDIFSSTADSNILFVATGSNHVLRSKNALSTTPTFTTITTPASTANTASIATVRSNKAIVFLTCGANVYRSADTGNTWTNITGTGLATGVNIRKIIHDDYSTTERLFVNAGNYVHYKDNTTTAWTNHSVSAGLPTVCNGNEFMIYNNGTAASILRYATYGRGVWQCDIDANLPPATDFFADKQVLCPGDTVHFTSSIYGNYTSLSWSFTGGTPSSSTAANPVVVYNTPGVYTVTLSATGANGTGTNTKTAFIVVSLGQQVAVQEGFEGAAYPPSGWQLRNASGNNWTQTTAGGGFGTSTHSIVFDNYNIDAQGKRDRILAPKVDLHGVTAAKLTFDVAYAPYGTSQPDSLQVRVSTDCGQTWTVVYNKTGTALGTAPALTSSTYVPAANEWRTETVSLTPYINNGILVSFDNIGHFGQALYIDNVNILPAPLTKFAANDTTVCIGTSVTFSDSSYNAAGWSWSFPGGSPSSSTSQNATVSYPSAGLYTVTLTATNGAGTGVTTKTNYIQVYAAPTVNITATATALTANGTAGTYQWLRNGTPITGATGQTYTPTASDVYSVIVTDANGCSTTSATQYFAMLGITSAAHIAGYDIFPNPSSGMLTIKASGIAAHEVSIQCYNAAGQLVRTELMKLSNGNASLTYDWSDLPKGIYELCLSSGAARPVHTSLTIQ